MPAGQAVAGLAIGVRSADVPTIEVVRGVVSRITGLGRRESHIGH